MYQFLTGFVATNIDIMPLLCPENMVTLSRLCCRVPTSAGLNCFWYLTVYVPHVSQHAGQCSYWLQHASGNTDRTAACNLCLFPFFWVAPTGFGTVWRIGISGTKILKFIIKNNKVFWLFFSSSFPPSKICKFPYCIQKGSGSASERNLGHGHGTL